MLRGGITCSAVIACALALAVGCSARGPSSDATGPVPGKCSRTLSGPSEVDRALATASPGETLCFTGTDLIDTELEVTASGKPDAPLTLAGGGTTVRSILVEADHVVVAGFSVLDGQGVEMEGNGLVARGNLVRNARENGISCTPCADATIESNTVERADGTGIYFEGDRVSVLANTVSGSERREENDADGIRFFGAGHRISGNTVRDIKDDVLSGEPPHTDCFQTYDNSKPPTTNVVISDNVCKNVDHQCLIATAEEAGTSGEIGRSHSIEFVGNTCSVEGSQALLIWWFPDVEVRDNHITGPNLDRGVIFLDGSTDGSVIGNTFAGDFEPFEVDESSQPGFRAMGNRST